MAIFVKGGGGGGGAADGNDAAKVSANDTTAGYLNGKLVAGTNITFTEGNDGGDETLTIAAAGGVTGFTGSQNTASPNNTVNASRLLVSATSTNADFVAQPKGTGALLAQLPDGAATGGNKRGAYAQDFQTSRAVNNEVASGAYSTVSGGYRNKATASNSVVVGGDTCEASGTASVAGGQVAKATGLVAVCFGRNNTSSNSYTTVSGGYNNTASTGRATVGGGESNLAQGSNSTIGGGNTNTTGPAAQFSSISGGFQALTNDYGQRAFASGRFVNNGDCQEERFLQRRETTTNAQTELSNDGASPSANKRIAIASDATYTFTGLVTARRTDADNESAGWEIKGVIDNNAGTTALVGSVTVTALGDDSAGTWLVAVEADNTNDALVIKVTGENSKTIRWGATVTLMKVAG